MYVSKESVATKHQQTGDEAEKERNTDETGVLREDENSVRVNNFIFLHW